MFGFSAPSTPWSIYCYLPGNLEGDTTLSATGRTVQEIGEKLTKDCEAVTTWMRANKLKLNPSKTHILTMGTQQRLNLLSNTDQVSMDGIQLMEEKDSCEIMLGCKVQANLKWQNQVTFLLRKLRTRLTSILHLFKSETPSHRGSLTVSWCTACRCMECVMWAS